MMAAAGGGNSGGSGGNATFNVDTLKLAAPNGQTLAFSSLVNGGTVFANIGTLNLGAGVSGTVNTAILDTSRSLSGGDVIIFGTLKFNGYSRFDGSTHPNTTYTINNYYISGIGNELDFRSTLVLTSGTVITVDLNKVRDGDTMLTAAAGSFPGFDISSLTKANLKFTYSGFMSQQYINQISDISPYTIIGKDVGSGGITATSGDFASGPVYYSLKRGLAVMEFAAEVGGDELLGSMKLSPMTRSGEVFKPYFEGLLGGLVALTESSNMISDGIIRQSVENVRVGDTALGLNTSVSRSKVETGSNVKSDNYNLALRLATKTDTSFLGTSGELTYGAFVEIGHGNYDTYNKFSNGSVNNGSGDTDYVGGGIFARHDFMRGFYAEGSLRVGSIDNQYSVDNIFGASYDTSSDYTGAHLGLGKKFMVSA